MKIKFEIELDTNDDADIGHELMDLVTAFKAKLEDFNQQDLDEEMEEYEEEIVAENPKPKRSRYKGRRRNS